MSEQEQQHDLTSTMQELMAQMAQMKAELDSLKARSQSLTPPLSQPKGEVSTSRRKLLRRLAGGMLAGLAMGSVAAAVPEQAQAGFVRSGGAGAILMRPGGTLTGSLPATTFYGLIATPDTTLNLGAFSAGYTAGMLGINAGTSSSSFGVFGQGGYTGVYGTSSVSSGRGVSGLATNSFASGVYGNANSTSSFGYGVYGLANGDFCDGVDGHASGAFGYGVYGTSSGSFGAAGYFQGSVTVTGALSKGGGSFKIDHPLDPANKYLYHSFVESPDMMNIYNGIVKLNGQGSVEVEMPVWFEALNSDFRYALAAIGTAMPNLHIAQKMNNRKFTIAGGLPGQEVSWMVTGIRQDEWAKAHRIPLEEDKQGEDKGRYLHPAEHGQGKDKSVDHHQRTSSSEPSRPG
jgi:hypothetical protein